MDTGLLEKTDNLLNAQPEPAQQGEYLLVSDPKGRLVEEYINGQKGIAFRYRDSLASAHSTQYGFIVAALNYRRSPRTHPGVPKIGHGKYGRTGNDEPLMLTHDVEVMEGPQRFIPSFVWFERFYNRSLMIRKPLFSFLTVQPGKRIDHVGETAEDWEMPIATRSFAVALGESGSDEIEGTSEGIEDRADPNIECERKRLFLDSYNQIAVRTPDRAHGEGGRGVPFPPKLAGLLGAMGFGLRPNRRKLERLGDRRAWLVQSTFGR